MTTRTETGTDPRTEACMDKCLECKRVCVETATYCVSKGGRHAEPEHLKHLVDCATICQTSADFMMHDSEQHGVVCRACAEICRRCAEACEQFSGDQVMERCAEVCRECAESCEEMASAG